jgi:hypothetical protein
LSSDYAHFQNAPLWQLLSEAQKQLPSPALFTFQGRALVAYARDLGAATLPMALLAFNMEFSFGAAARHDEMRRSKEQLKSMPWINKVKIS